MSSAPLPTPARPAWEEPHPARWLFLGLALMFVLIGASILIDAVFRGPAWMGMGHPDFGWTFSVVWSVFWLVVVLWILLWMFRWAFRVGVGSHGDWYGRRRWRWDQASSIARERYARGEISKDQYDQIIRDLDRA